MHVNARMLKVRTTIELSDRTYTRLRARAAERGMRGFSRIVEEALERFLDQGAANDLATSLAEAEGAWNEHDVAEWEGACKEAWKTWPREPSSTPMS
jgi:predicted transcriptional regulator